MSHLAEMEDPFLSDPLTEDDPWSLAQEELEEAAALRRLELQRVRPPTALTQVTTTRSAESVCLVGPSSEACHRCGRPGGQVLTFGGTKISRPCRECEREQQAVTEKRKEEEQAERMRLALERMGLPDGYTGVSLWSVKDAIKKGAPARGAEMDGWYYADTASKLSAARFLRHFDPMSGWVMLTGPRGQGKTHLAAGLGMRLAERGIGRWFAESALLSLGLNPDFGSALKREVDELKTAAVNARYLIWDDLGWMPDPPEEEEADSGANPRRVRKKPYDLSLYPKGMRVLAGSIIMTRYSHRRPTLFTTNLDRATLSQLLGKTIVDRIWEMCGKVRVPPPAPGEARPYSVAELGWFELNGINWRDR